VRAVAGGVSRHETTLGAYLQKASVRDKFGPFLNCWEAA
jgi:hypothetical protein